MTFWTHLIRFIAIEDGQEHLGQLVDTSIDVGIASFEGRNILAYHIVGSMYDGKITDTALTVKQVSLPIVILCHLVTSLKNITVAVSYPQRGLQLYPLSRIELHGSC